MIGDIQEFKVRRARFVHVLNHEPSLELAFTKAIPEALTNSFPDWLEMSQRPEKLKAEAEGRVAVEMGVRQGWEKYLGARGRFVGMSGFGASAPAGVLFEHFGFTAANVVAQAKAARGGCK